MPSKIPYHRPKGMPTPAQNNRAYRRSPGRAALEAFYASARWKKLSALFKSENPLCSACEREGRTTLGEYAHHEPPLTAERLEAEGIGAGLVWEELVCLCREHHSKAHPKGSPSR
jgi:hypothetical protein